MVIPVAVASWRQKLANGEVGFEIQERMSGSHRFTERSDYDGTYPMAFTATWGPDSLLTWLNPSNEEFMRHPMEGTVNVGGLCTDTDFTGYMELRYFSEAKIRYAFDFKVDGVPYHYYGEKSNLRPWNLLRTHTTLHGEITEVDSGTVISESTLYFELTDLPSMLQSFRLR